MTIKRIILACGFALSFLLTSCGGGGGSGGSAAGNQNSVGTGQSVTPAPSPTPSPSPSPTPSPDPVAGNWSDPETWPSGAVPVAGDSVVVDEHMTVTLDISPPVLDSLTIDGSLIFDDEDLALQTDWILLRGEMHIGSSTEPFTHQATITLRDRIPDEQIGVMGDRGIFVMGGQLELHGNRTHTWTKLEVTALAGDNMIRVQDASGWQVNDEIVVASTDFDPTQAEKKVITALNGNLLTLDSPLEYMHYGEVTYGVDQRAEVALLSRNILIQSSADSESSFKGGHLATMAPGQLHISGVEFYRMGQHLGLGRYPVHWHVYGDATGQYVEHSSMHHSFNRCVTVHGTHNVRVENNVTYNTVGHCFFLEDGNETNNRFINNLSIQTKCHPVQPCRSFLQGVSEVQSVLLPSDNNASSFWITNPDNSYTGNVAAGSEGIGFWIALPEHPTGPFLEAEERAAIWPRRTALREFVGNVAHSNVDGLMFDRGPNADGTIDVQGNEHNGFVDPDNTNSSTVMSVIEDFTAYKNSTGGIWARGSNHEFRNIKLADNAIGITQADGNTSFLYDSLIVGESDNIGNPEAPSEISYGRSLPKPVQAPDYPIHGFEFYDLVNGFSNVTFRNFQGNTMRDAAAISFLLYTNFTISTENSAAGAIFENAQPVLFPEINNAWATQNQGSDGYKGAIFEDEDGSVGGTPGSYIVIYNGFLLDDDACSSRPDWNAAVCTGDYGRLWVGDEAAGTVTLQRVDNGGVIDVLGHGFGGPHQTTVRYDTEFTVETQNNVSRLNIRASEGDQDSWLILELPEYANGSANRAEVNSMSALRSANVTSYYSSSDALYIKIVMTSFNAPFGTSVTACRASVCL